MEGKMKTGDSIKPKRRMMRWVLLVISLGLPLLCVGMTLLHSLSALRWARGMGIYETPQQGVIAMANKGYCGVEKVDIRSAGPNAFDGSNPHIWYVIFRVYAKNRVPCDLQHPGYVLPPGQSEGGGYFFLNTVDGWVWMPEGRFPQIVGKWMQVLGLAGPGDAQVE
jgi:hypothetical protein